MMGKFNIIILPPDEAVWDEQTCAAHGYKPSDEFVQSWSDVEFFFVKSYLDKQQSCDDFGDFVCITWGYF